MVLEGITWQQAIPEALANLLRAASDAERAAGGPQRRDAFRNTRHLLAGARVNGFAYDVLGDLLGVSPGSIRNRTADNGPIRAIQFADLAAVSLDELAGWRDKGLLGDATPDPDGYASYLASDLIHALLTTRAGAVGSNDFPTGWNEVAKSRARTARAFNEYPLVNLADPFRTDMPASTLGHAGLDAPPPPLRLIGDAQMAERPVAAVPDLVGQPVDIAGEMAAAIGLVLSSGDPDGPGIRSRSWPGLFWVTAQDPSAGSLIERGSRVQVTFVEDGQTRSDVPSQTEGPPPSLKSHADPDAAQ